MNKKFLFGMFVSGALLTACTADDFESAPVAQDVNLEAPVFNVTFEEGDLETRGSLDSQYRIVWGDGDLMSLFHGVATNNLTNFTGWQNAIYEGHGSGEGAGNEAGSLTFVTNAMVQKGYAVMVYPADTGFDQTPSGTGTTYPKISLPATQNADTKGNTPFVSEILNLQDGTNGSGKAGYREEYDIKMKRAAGTLVVNLVPTKQALNLGEGVDEFKINSVELKAGSTNTPFTKTVEVKPVSMEREHPEGDVHTYWAYNTEVVAKADGAMSSLITTDIENNTKITYTILPEQTGVSNTTGDDVEEKGASSKYAEATVVLHTNYGDITVGKGDKNWVGNTKVTTAAALNTMIGGNLFQAKAAGDFKGEVVGNIIVVNLEVDLSAVNLDGMHVRDEKDLRTAMAVFEQTKSQYTTAPTLKLDGEGEGGEFLITDLKLLNTVSEYMTAETPAIKFEACTTPDEKCNIIKIDNGTTDTEVPELNFEGSQQVTVQLAGTGKWTYNSVRDEEEKVLTGVKQLTVLAGATLELQSDEILQDGNCEMLEVAKGGKLNVVSFANVDMNINNHGTIEIAENKKLSLSDGKTLINWWSEIDENDKTEFNLGAWHQTTDETYNRCGVIKNYGTLGATPQQTGGTTSAKIHNYGVIVLENDDAVAMISTNEIGEESDSKATTAKAFEAPTYDAGSVTGGNVFGVIDLKANKAGGNGMTKVADDNLKGFIKLTIGKDNAGKDIDVTKGNVGDIANYIVVESNSVNATTANNAAAGIGGALYLEMKAAKVNIYNAISVTGLFVHESSSVTAVNGANITVNDNIYLKGSLTGSGTLQLPTTDPYVGYYGGKASDYTHNTIPAASN